MLASDAYILVSTALIFGMSVVGLPLLYGGLVQSKHAMSVMTQCLAVVAVVGILWLFVGFSLSFSGTSFTIGSGSILGNLDMAFLMPEIRERDRVYQHPDGPLPESVYFMFQAAFACVTAALIVGSWAERAKFGPAVFFCGAWSLLVYCPICHWIWGGGWLQQMGFRDFAGGCVVHASAGAASLVAARMLPSRPGFPKDLSPPHSLPLALGGLGIIWVGWFGFNGASALKAGGSAGMATVTTQTSAIVAMVTWVCIEWCRSKPTVDSVINGAIAGLGAITPGSGYLGVPGAIIVGMVASIACYLAWYFCLERGYADDALCVFPIHGIGGVVGTIMVALLSPVALGGVGLPHNMDMGRSFAIQCLGVAATFAWSALISIFLIGGARICGLEFCHTTTAQLKGLDLEDHASEAYSTALAEGMEKATYGSTAGG